MTVLITGASGALGAAVVPAFLDSGATVYAVARAGGASSGNLHWISADLSAPAGCEAVVGSVPEPDVLAHLMGSFAGGTPVQESPDPLWEEMLDINLRPAWRLFRGVIPGMLRRGRGRLIAVGSRAGTDPMANFGAYSVSKAALTALVRTIAAETRGTGVTANIVMPSVIDTPANRAAMPGADTSAWVQPASLASVIVWLASDAAVDINGAVIPVYGGA